MPDPRWAWNTLASVALVAGTACGGSTGTLVNPQQPLGQIVHERDVLLVETGNGLERIAIDGTGRELLVAAKYRLLSMSPDARVIALEDSDTNFWIWDAATKTPRRVTALDGRLGDAAVSPDGKTVAATQHPDLDSKTDKGVDAVWLVDVATLHVTTIPKSRDEWAVRIAWSRAGDALLLGLWGGDQWRLDLATKARTKLAEWPYAEMMVARGNTIKCAATGEELRLRGWKGDEGIEIVDAQGNARPLVTIEGRSRGFHDYRATIDDATFTPSCKYVLFEHLGLSIYVVDVATGAIAKLIDGSSPRLITP